MFESFIAKHKEHYRITTLMLLIANYCIFSANTFFGIILHFVKTINIKPTPQSTLDKQESFSTKSNTILLYKENFIL